MLVVSLRRSMVKRDLFRSTYTPTYIHEYLIIYIYTIYTLNNDGRRPSHPVREESQTYTVRHRSSLEVASCLLTLVYYDYTYYLSYCSDGIDAYSNQTTICKLGPLLSEE